MEKVIYINNNAFIYSAEETMFTEEDMEILKSIAVQTTEKSFYVYKEDGKLVVY